MDEELKALLEKANANLEKLEVKVKSVETENATLKEMQEKASKLDHASKSEVASLKDELRNEIADLETKVKSGSPVVTIDQKALTLAFKNAVGKFAKLKDNTANFKSFVELEVKAALNISNTGEGLESIAEVLSREIIERARELYPIVGEIRTRNMPRNLREEVLLSFPSVQEGIENVAGTSISETEVQRYGEVVNQVAKVNAKPRVTDEAMAAPDLDIYAHLLDLLQDEVGRYLAQQILFGNGTGKNMRGILSSNRVNITNLTGESWKPTFGAGARDLDFYPAYGTGVSASLPATDIAIVDWLIDLTTALPTKYLANAKFYMNRRTLAKFKKVRDANEQPVFLPTYMGQTMSLMGYPVVIEDYMPDIAADSLFMIFGDLKQAFSMSPGDIDKMLLDPYTVDGCTVVKVDKEYFEMVGKTDSILVCAATANAGA